MALTPSSRGGRHARLTLTHMRRRLIVGIRRLMATLTPLRFGHELRQPENFTELETIILGVGARLPAAVSHCEILAAHELSPIVSLNTEAVHGKIRVLLHTSHQHLL